MTTLNRLPVLLAIIGASALGVRAANVSGSYSNDCGGLTKLWDLSGTYSEDNGTETENMTLTMDAKGAISGQGHFNVTDDYSSAYLDGDYTVSGHVKSAGSVTRVSMVFKITSGTGNVMGYDVVFGATLNEDLELDPVSRELVGNSKGKLRLRVPSLGRSGSKRIPSSPVSAALPDGVDGAWGLAFNITPNGTRYGGTSTIYLSNGKTLDLGVTGVYSTRTDLSKILLKSTDRTWPLNLNLTATSDGQNIMIGTLKGTTMGQKIKFTQ